MKNVAKKFFTMLIMTLCLTIFTTAITGDFGIKTVQAKTYDYNNVKKTFDKVTVSQSGGHKYSYSSLATGKTNVYPIQVKEKAEYVIGFKDFADGFCSILVVDSKGKPVYEKKFLLLFDKGWKKTISLSEGTYYIKILSKDDYFFRYEFYIKPAVTIKKETKSIKMTSCDNKTLSPKLGKGEWSTSNENIIAISSKNSNNIASCEIKAKKAGSATVTYKNSSGSVIKYIITVSATSIYPLDRAYFTMDFLGGLEPHILISNNSDKTIKYVDFKVSFYNAVGDKLKNDIGGSNYAKLQITGPLKAWMFSWYSWNPVFYSNTATKMKIETMTVTYTDGSKKTVNINKKYSLK